MCGPTFIFYKIKLPVNPHTTIDRRYGDGGDDKWYVCKRVSSWIFLPQIFWRKGDDIFLIMQVFFNFFYR